MLKRVLGGVPALVVLVIGISIGPRFDRFVLPSFDGHPYAAMAENPQFFTIPPWGFRILAPTIVSFLPFSSEGAGFHWLNVLLLAGTVTVIAAWLRRLGFSSLAAVLAATGFGLSPPVRLLLEYQILVDPLAIFLMSVILYELDRPDLLSLTSLFALAALAKETTLLCLTLVPLVLVPREGLTRGLLHSAIVAAPACFLSFVLRTGWGYISTPSSLSSFSVFDLTLGRVIESARLLGGAALLSGLALPGLVGMFRETSSRLRLQAAILWSFAFALIVANPYRYSAADLPRLSVFAWPALLPIALAGLGFKRKPEKTLESPPSTLRSRLAVAGLLVSLTLVAMTDPYIRAPFERAPDPIAMVGRLRESLKAARAMDRGEAFVFDARQGRFASPVTEDFNLTEARRQRWFLYRGFGPRAAFGVGAPAFDGRAHWLLPLLTPRPMELSFVLESGEPALVRVSIGRQVLGSIRTDGSETVLLAPEHALIRGDNLLTLTGPRGVSVRVVRFAAAFATRREAIAQEKS